MSDRKIEYNNQDYYTADVVSYSDYSPYGTLLDGRHGQQSAGADDYRYGFQSQENDKEVKDGDGLSWNYNYRMHDPRIGRFFAIDPLAPQYPFYSPYQFSGNRPIDCVELEGLEPSKTGKKYGERAVAQDGITGEWQKYSWSKITSDIDNWKPIGNYFQDINKKQIHIPNDATKVVYKQTGGYWMPLPMPITYNGVTCTKLWVKPRVAILSAKLNIYLLRSGPGTRVYVPIGGLVDPFPFGKTYYDVFIFHGYLEDGTPHVETTREEHSSSPGPKMAKE